MNNREGQQSAGVVKGEVRHGKAVDVGEEQILLEGIACILKDLSYEDEGCMEQWEKLKVRPLTLWTLGLFLEQTTKALEEKLSDVS